MPTLEHSVEIAAPVQEVYRFGLDPENWLRANPALTDIEPVEETDEVIRVDATYDMLVTTVDGKVELTIIEPYSHTVVRLDSPSMAAAEAHYHFSETHYGTKLDQEVDYEFGESLLEQLIEPVAKRYTKRQFDSFLENTKDFIEAEVGTTTKT